MTTAHRNRLWRDGAWHPYKRTLTPEQQAEATRRNREWRHNWTPQEHEIQLAKRRARRAARRAAETPEQAAARRERTRAANTEKCRTYYKANRARLNELHNVRVRERREARRMFLATVEDVSRVPELVALLTNPPPVRHPQYLRWCDQVYEVAKRSRPRPRHPNMLYGLLVLARAQDKQAQAAAFEGARNERLADLVQRWQAFQIAQRQTPHLRKRVANRKPRPPLTDEQREARRVYKREWTKRRSEQGRTG